MKTTNLIEFFNEISYDWTQDKDKIECICKYTKTRVKPNLARKPFQFPYGSEQTFLIKAIAEWSKAKNFFEIGTGRGTAAYAVSLVPAIEQIYTLDIIPFDQKMNTAIDYQAATVSNSDLYNMIPFEEKQKIIFQQRRGTTGEWGMTNLPDGTLFDVSFIDGNHSDPSIIIQDFLLCQKVMKPNGWIIWDDYSPREHQVKPVVDATLKRYPNTTATLIEFRGHLFDQQHKERDSGVVLMKLGE